MAMRSILRAFGAITLLSAFVAVGATPAAAVTAAATSGPYFQTLTFNSAIDINRGSWGYLLDDGTRVAGCCRDTVASVANGGANSTVSIRVRATTTPATQFVYMGYGAGSDGRTHLVLGLDSAFSASLIGRDFAAVFPAYDEAAVIDALTRQFDGTPQGVTAAALVNSFQATLFDRNAGFGQIGAFGLTSFSTGTAAGSGLASVSPVATAVPEPGTWVMLLCGFGAVGSAMRRRRMAVRLA